MTIIDITAPARVPWKPSDRQRDEQEQAFFDWLDQNGIAFAHEDVLLAENGDALGFAPDVHIFATNEWPEQFIEFSRANNPAVIKAKVCKIRRALDSHDARIILVMGGTRRPHPPGVEHLHFSDIKDHPELFKDHLRGLSALEEVS